MKLELFIVLALLGSPALAGEVRGTPTEMHGKWCQVGGSDFTGTLRFEHCSAHQVRNNGAEVNRWSYLLIPDGGICDVTKVEFDDEQAVYTVNADCSDGLGKRYKEQRNWVLEEGARLKLGENWLSYKVD